MADKNEFQDIFTALRNILNEHEKKLVLVNDKPDNYYLNTAFIMKNKKPMYFGATIINKNYVSFHLMPVYVNPGLLKDMSSELKKRMQGKSCFNFKKMDKDLFKELEKITKAGFSDYKKQGYL